jgi:serine O-acetyltransferase
MIMTDSHWPGASWEADFDPGIDLIVERLCRISAIQGRYLARPILSPATPMPSVSEMRSIIDSLRSALFPGFFDEISAPSSLRRRLAALLEAARGKLERQIRCALLFAGESPGEGPGQRQGEEGPAQALELSRSISHRFIEALPDIRNNLAADVQAACDRDPAASGPAEVIYCYPSIAAMLHYRIGHELYRLGAPLLPRIVCEIAHSALGIDIHPGARIGEGFFVDHGTGTVIGETCVIGRDCCLYQGVTLGALSFPRSPDGRLVRGRPRHPHLGDRVTVYAGASILGCVSIGSDSVIGANAWVTRDVPAKARLVMREREEPDG